MDQSLVAGLKQEGRNLLQALSSALFFGIPLLYTMEMWWIGWPWGRL